MKCICGFMKPDSGNIVVNGQRVGKDCDFPDRLGVIIETPGFLPNLSGFKNLKIFSVAESPDRQGRNHKNIGTGRPESKDEKAGVQILPWDETATRNRPGDYGRSGSSYIGRTL